MLKVGLTGGIGSGKSTVCSMFQGLGAEIIDADIIARQLVIPGSPVLGTLVEMFGEQILDAEGYLDRAKLRDLVFSASEKKQLLEDIMHPLIYKQIDYEFKNLKGLYCIVAVPLLMETKQTKIVDRVLVVDCSLDTQLERVAKRDKLSREQILSIVASQMPRHQRIAQADDVIDNTSSLDQLAEQVKRLHNSYIFLATVRTSSA